MFDLKETIWKYIDTRNIYDKNRRFGASCAIIKVIISDKKAVCEKAKLKANLHKECQANYINTLRAIRE